MSELYREGEQHCYFCGGKTMHSTQINGKWLDRCTRCDNILRGFDK